MAQEASALAGVEAPALAGVMVRAAQALAGVAEEEATRTVVVEGQGWAVVVVVGRALQTVVAAAKWDWAAEMAATVRVAGLAQGAVGEVAMATEEAVDEATEDTVAAVAAAVAAAAAAAARAAAAVAAVGSWVMAAGGRASAAAAEEGRNRGDPPHTSTGTRRLVYHQTGSYARSCSTRRWHTAPGTDRYARTSP